MLGTFKSNPPNFLRLYFNRRLMILLLFGFSSGLPLVLMASTLQAWYTESGVSIMTIGALSLLGQPYTWKFLWAPIFDRFELSRLGRRRSWIIVCQLSIVISLIWISFYNPITHPVSIAVLALMTTFAAASQDTVIDAYRTDFLVDAERGAGAALTSLGYRIAMLVSGSFALIIAHEWGWHTTYFMMALLMLLCIFISIKAPEPQQEPLPEIPFRAAVVAPFLIFLKQPYVTVIIAFIITYKLTDALALSLNTYFILHFLQFSLIDLGAITKVSGLCGVFLGSILGGSLYVRLGLYRSLLYFGLLQAFSALLFALLTVVGKNYILMALCIFGENFCSGLSSVACVVYLTALCNRSYSATQYALFSAIMSLGRVYVGPLAAYLVQQVGWFDFYIISFLVGFFPLVLLRYLRDKQSILISG